MINEPFGWLWALAGFVSGAVFGLRFQREEWLGGYASRRRRLLRLGHISFIGLGIFNILFAHSVERLRLDASWVTAASWSLIIGAATMPLCCGLTAWKRRAQPAFAIPVASLLLGGTIVVAGMLRR